MQEIKEILRNPVRNGFLGPKNKFLKTGIGNLGYQEKKEMAWKCKEALTPYGRKLRDAIFERVDFRKYNIHMGESHDDRWECTVTRVGRGHVDRRCYFMKEESEGGTPFGGSSCWIPYTDGVPCHHMIAV